MGKLNKLNKTKDCMSSQSLLSKGDVFVVISDFATKGRRIISTA